MPTDHDLSDPLEGVPRYVSRTEATSIVGLSRQQIEHLLHHGRFPPPVVIGVGTSSAQSARGWLLDDLTRWRGDHTAISDREPVVLWTVYRVVEYYDTSNNSAYWMPQGRWPTPVGVIGVHVQRPRAVFDPDEVHRVGIAEGFLDSQGRPARPRRRRAS